VGPSGRVVAIDRSRRFLDVLEARSQQRGLKHIQTVELDLDGGKLPTLRTDGAWVRWVFAFMKQPRELLTQVAGALRPGGVVVIHEYLDYSTWRTAPRLPEIEEFVEVVMKSWRADGGEPDIGLQLPGWLRELGFEIRELRPLIEVIPASSYMWQWPKAFINVGVKRMTDLGQLSAEQSQAILSAFAGAEASPGTLMITPLVIEIIAVRQ
jgi:SAM-dependent methyltransferase